MRRRLGSAGVAAPLPTEGDIFLEKPRPLHDILQKAAGWLLREAGKRDEERLKSWLSTRYMTMPRTMLRYAVEKFPEEERLSFLKK